MTAPHEYQANYLAAIKAGREIHRKQLVVSPTGSGKTNLFCWMAEEEVKKGNRVLILADQDELVFEPIKRYRALTGLEAQPEKAEHRASLSASVVVASVQTMTKLKRLQRWPQEHFSLVIADEADKSIAPTWMRVLKHFDEHADVIGFTATPHRADGQNLGCYYEHVIELESLWSLIRKGFLAPISIQSVPINIDLESLTKTRGDFDERELDEIITPYLYEMAKAVQLYGSFRRSLVFLPLVETCRKFDVICRDLGMNSNYIHGTDEDRDGKLQRFKNWEIDVLANSMLLTRGVDVPGIELIALYRFTKSVSLLFQMVGRGTRIAPGKTDCILLDPMFQNGSKLVKRPAHLIAKTEEEAQEIIAMGEGMLAGMPVDIIGQLDLMEVAAKADNAREEALRRKLEEMKNKKAQQVSAEEFASRHKADVSEFSEVQRFQQPVSDKQKKYLEEANINLDTVHGYAHASKLLDIHFRTKPIKLASFAQRRKMKQMGDTNWATATEQEARQFFARMRMVHQ